jgi:hypothetical protein
MQSANLLKCVLLALIIVLTLPGYSQTTLYAENFESSSASLDGFVLANIDKGAVIQEGWTALSDSAWIVRRVDGFSYAAIASSAYEPPKSADDWFITPMIYIGSNSKLSWDALSLTASLPDSYEVYISTSSQSVNGCLLNFPALDVNQEQSGDYRHHLLDLAALGYKNQSIYVGFRLNTATGGDKLAIDNITVVDDSIASGVSLTFIVDMSKYTAAGLFNPATDTVDIAGNFNNWDGTSHIMAMVPESDSAKYAVTIAGFYDGMELEFKFRINSSWNDTALEFPYGGPNRHWILQHGLYTYSAFYNEAGVISGLPSGEARSLYALYPNPVHSLLIADFPGNTANVRIYSLQGKLLREYNPVKGTQTLDVGDLPPGNYIAIFSLEKRLITSQRFVKL